MIPATEAKPRPDRRQTWSPPGWTGWLAPVLLAGLGAVALSRGYGFWYDEAYTAEMARVSVPRLLEAFVTGEGTVSYLRDAPPSYNAPYYLAVHLWLAVTRLAPSEFGLRLLSLLAAVAAVVVLARAVTRLAGPQAGLAAGLFTACNPFVVQYSVEARGYALAVLAVCLAALGLSRWLDGGRRSDVVLFGTASAAAGLLHWYALLAVGGLAVAAAVLRRRGALAVVGAAGLAAVPAAAVVGVAVANGVGASGAEWLRGVGAAVPWLLLRSWSGRSLVLAAATVGTVTLGLRARGRAGVVAAGWVGLPLAAVTVGELVRPVFVDRYLLPAAIGLAVLGAVGVASLRRPAAAVLAGVVLVASLAATVTDLRRPPKDDVKSAMGTVAARHPPGDPVVAAARWDALGVDHYARREHPELVADLVLVAADVPSRPVVWVVRRAVGGVKGDQSKLEALDQVLAGRGLAVSDQWRFEGRYADVLVQRWAAAQASVRAD